MKTINMKTNLFASLAATLVCCLLSVSSAFAQLTAYTNADTSICPGVTTYLYCTSTGGIGRLHYQWFPSTGVQCDTCQNTLVTPVANTTYTVQITDSLGNSDTASVAISVALVAPTASITVPTTGVCSGSILHFNSYYTFGGSSPSFQWLKNNVTVGISTNYIDSNLHAGDSIQMILTSSSACAFNPIAYSNVIYIIAGVLRTSVTQTLCYGQTYGGYAASGTYIDTFALAGGCDSIRTLHLTVNPIPTGALSLSASGGSCLGATTLAVSGVTSGLPVQWVRNGQPLNVVSNGNIISTVAGGNGYGTAANQFSVTSNIGMDASHNLYVVDYFNNRVQKWAPGATNGITVAGGNGQGAALNQMSRPVGLVIDASGNLYVSEEFGQRVTKWAPGATAGVIVAGGNGQGTAANQFNKCWGLSLDAAGNLYVADHLNNRIQKFAPGSSTGVTVAGGLTAGSAANQLNGPVDVFVDANGYMYVTDDGNNRVLKYAPGSTTGVTVAGGNGIGSAANQLNGLGTIYVDATGNLYLTDVNNFRVQKWPPGATSGITVAGGNGAGTAANQLNWPSDVVVMGTDIYVSDYNNSRVQKWSPANFDTTYVPDSAGVYTAVVSNGFCSISSNQITVNDTMVTASIAISQNPICLGNPVTFTATVVNGGTSPIYRWYKNGINQGAANTATYIDNALTANDSIWVKVTSSAPCAPATAVESNHIRISVRSNAATVVNQTICQGQTYAGYITAGTYSDTFVLSGGCDSIRTLHLTVNPTPAITLTATAPGCLNNTTLVLNGGALLSSIQWFRNGQLISSQANTITTVAGGNGYGSAANQFSVTADIKMDANHNLYVVDYFNNRVQKWAQGATSGVTVAGGNGQGSALNQLSRPVGIALDAAGNIYVAEEFNERVTKWAPGATVGIVVAGGNGPGTAANQFNRCWGMDIDAFGNLYVADHFNNRIQKFAPGSSTGVTVAGGITAGSGANQLNHPVDVFVDASGNIYVTDDGNNRIQKFVPGSTTGVTVAGGNGLGSAANQLNGLGTIYVDATGDMYIADVYNYRVQKWAVGATSGVTVAGGNGQGSGVNQFNWVSDVIVDGNDIYVSDYHNSRVQKWSMGGSDTILIPDSAGIYTASASNGLCTATTNAINVQPCPALMDTIWPGDADHNGIANMYDILSLGLAYQDTGSVRANADNSWTGQACQPWNNAYINGVNHDHGDCTGDGVIDANDTLPVLLNYGLIHNKNGGQRSIPGAPSIFFDIPASDSLSVNTPYALPVNLGMETDSVSNAYGIAFTINYDSTVMIPNSAYFTATNSWLGTVNTDLMYIQKHTVAGQLDCAVTRTNHVSRNGFGTIGTFGFITIDNLSGKKHLEDSLHLSISNIRLIDQDGVELPINTQEADLKVTQDVEGIANVAPSYQLNLYPNPATNYINYSITGLNDKATYSITDITGRELMASDIAGKGINIGNLNLSSLAKGIYMFKLSSTSGSIIKKIVLQ